MMAHIKVEDREKERQAAVVRSPFEDTEPDYEYMPAVPFDEGRYDQRRAATGGGVLKVYAETDPSELQYSQLIMLLFYRMEKLEEALEPFIDPAHTSALFADDVRIQHYPVSAYAFSQLTVAIGCVAALKQMIVRESSESISLVAAPFGAYALVRNALDSGATALWLLEPINGTLRIKRRILLAVDEAGKSSAFRQSMGKAATSQARRARLKEIAAAAGLRDWNPLKDVIPSMTRTLQQIERLHTTPNKVLPWLAAWQLSSGHAHGKNWAQIASNELEEMENTRTETGAQFRMTIKYGLLATVLFETVELLETAATRYVELAMAK